MVFFSPESRERYQRQRGSELSWGGDSLPSLKREMRRAIEDDMSGGGGPKGAILIWLPFHMWYGMVCICRRGLG